MTGKENDSAKPYAEQAERTRALLIGGAFAKQSSASKRLSVSPTQMSRVLAGRRRPSAEMLFSWDIELARLAHSGSADNPEFEYEPGTLQEIWGDEEPATPASRTVEGDPPVEPGGDEVHGALASGLTIRFAGVAVVALLLMGFIARAVVGSDEPVSAGDATNPVGLDGETAACPEHFVDFVEGSQFNFEPDSAVMVGAVVKSRSVYNWPCAVELGRSFFDGRLVMTPLVDRDGRQSFLVSTSPTEAVVLSLEQWLSVIEVEAWADAFDVELPLPKRYEPATTDSSLVATGNWRLVGPDLNERHVLLPPAVYEAWRSSGGQLGQLGQPISNGYLAGGEMRFDFAGGYLEMPLVELGSPQAEVALVGNKTLGLPSPAQRPDVVVIQDGSAWLRDGPVRYWIPTPALRSCLEGQHSQPVESTGTALARIAYNGIAECEVAES